jgi:hypothetical protein
MIMLKFKKLFSIKAASVIVAATFFLDSIAFGIDLSNKAHLRIPLSGTKRIEKSLSFTHPVPVSPLPVRRKLYSRKIPSSLPNAADHLGTVIIFNTVDLATDVTVTPVGARLEFKGSKLSREMNAMLELFKTTNTALTYYLWATLKTSWVSRLVHGLNYEEAGKISEGSGNQALLEYIRKKKGLFRNSRKRSN